MNTNEPTTAQLAVYRVVVSIIKAHRERGRTPEYALQLDILNKVLELAHNGQPCEPVYTIVSCLPRSRQDVLDVLHYLVMSEMLITGPTATDRYYTLPWSSASAKYLQDTTNI